MICPICGRFSPDGSLRCTACGADVRDPDVQALMRAPRVPTRIPEAAAGALGNDRLLGMTGAGIADGTSLRVVGVVAATALLLGALLPALGAHTPFTTGVSRVAVAVPLVLAGALLAVAVPPRGILPPSGVAALLAAGGLVELLLGITPFGMIAATPTALPLFVWLGVAITAIGVAIRVLRPTDPYAAGIAAAGALVFILGGLLPHGDVFDRLPLELRGIDASADRSFFITLWTALPYGPLFPLAAAHLVPLLLLPLAALLAARRPHGLWDAPGNALRALGLAIVLWLPAVFVVAAADHQLLPRLRLALLAFGAMLSLTAGGAALYIMLRASITAAATRSGSAR